MLRLDPKIKAEAMRLAGYGYRLLAIGNYARFLLGGPEAKPDLALDSGPFGADSLVSERMAQGEKTRSAVGAFVNTQPLYSSFCIDLRRETVYDPKPVPPETLTHECVAGRTDWLGPDQIVKAKEWQKDCPGEHRLLHGSHCIERWTVEALQACMFEGGSIIQYTGPATCEAALEALRKDAKLPGPYGHVFVSGNSFSYPCDMIEGRAWPTAWTEEQRRAVAAKNDVCYPMLWIDDKGLRFWAYLSKEYEAYCEAKPGHTGIFYARTECGALIGFSPSRVFWTVVDVNPLPFKAPVGASLEQLAKAARLEFKCSTTGERVKA